MSIAKIIVLAGQSNAVGVGHTEYLKNHFSKEKIKEYKNGYKNVLINYFSHDIKSKGFVKTTVGCTEKSKKTLGPEVGIAETITQKYPEEAVFIVKCAFGGTNLYHDWMSPSYKSEYDELACADGDSKGDHYRTAGWCFNELVAVLKESTGLLQEKGYIPKIYGFCWMQGESDADTAQHAAQYGERYSVLLKDFTEIFGEYTDSCVYVDGGISEIWNYYKEINECKKAHAEKTKNSYYIDTVAEGLTTDKEPQPEVDFAHYDSDCIIKLGNMFADKIDLK